MNAKTQQTMSPSHGACEMSSGRRFRRDVLRRDTFHDLVLPGTTMLRSNLVVFSWCFANVVSVPWPFRESMFRWSRCHVCLNTSIPAHNLSTVPHSATQLLGLVSWPVFTLQAPSPLVPTALIKAHPRSPTPCAICLYPVLINTAA